MKLAKVRVLFLSPTFYPVSPVSSYWEIVHTHMPSTTFSGILLRAVLFVLNPKWLRGDYIPCEIGEGVFARVSRRGDGGLESPDWVLARRENMEEFLKQGYRPPYVEYHFKAASLGAYPVSMLKGYQPKVGVANKYWNVIKYIDQEDYHLFAPVKVGIKTWHYTVLDGSKIDGERHQTYEVVKVRHVLHAEDVYGFVLVDDLVVENLLYRLSQGWFIVKSRLKNLVALKVEELLTPVDGTGRVDYLVPMLTKPRKLTYSFTTAILDRSMPNVEGLDRLIVKQILHTTDEPALELDNLLLFASENGTIYGVDFKWREYLSLAEAGK